MFVVKLALRPLILNSISQTPGANSVKKHKAVTVPYPTSNMYLSIGSPSSCTFSNSPSPSISILGHYIFRSIHYKSGAPISDDFASHGLGAYPRRESADDRLQPTDAGNRCHIHLEPSVAVVDSRLQSTSRGGESIPSQCLRPLCVPSKSLDYNLIPNTDGSVPFSTQLAKRPCTEFVLLQSRSRSASIPKDSPSRCRLRSSTRSSCLFRAHALKSTHNRPLSRLLLHSRRPVDDRRPCTCIARFTAVARSTSTRSWRWRSGSCLFLRPAHGRSSGL
jgi:hypothetical protein